MFFESVFLRNFFEYQFLNSWLTAYLPKEIDEIINAICLHESNLASLFYNYLLPE
jgi:hypothetical protein